MREASKSRFMRRKQVEHELSIGRHTLANIIKKDPTFPRFARITAGIEIIERAEFEQWLRLKRLSDSSSGHESTALDTDQL